MCSSFQVSLTVINFCLQQNTDSAASLLEVNSLGFVCIGFLTRLILASFSDYSFGFLNQSLTTDTFFKKNNTLKNISLLFPEVEGKLTFLMSTSVRVKCEVLYYLFILRYLPIFTFGYEQFRLIMYVQTKKKENTCILTLDRKLQL